MNIASVLAAGILVVAPGALVSHPVVLDQETRGVVPTVAFYPETGAPLAVTEVARAAFQSLPATKFESGAQPVWLKFKVVNPQATTAHWHLKLNYPHLDRVELFAQEEAGTYRKFVAGDALPFAARQLHHRQFTFRVSQAPDSEETFYLKIQTRLHYRLGLSIWTPQALAEANSREELLFGSFFGAMGIIALYNLFLFLSTREPGYFFYCVWVGTLSFFLFTFEGFSFQYLWPESPWLNSGASLVLLALSICSGPFFVRSFLRTRRMAPAFDRLLFASSLAALVCGGLVFYDPFLSLRGSVLVGLCATVVTFIAGPVTYLRGFRPARFMILANSVFLVCAVLMALTYYGPFPENFLTRYGLYIGSALEALLLSFGLADRINDGNTRLRLMALSRDYMQSILSSLHESMIILRENGIVRTCNPATRELTGYAPDELEGRPIGDLFAGPSPFRTGDNLDWKYDGIHDALVRFRHRDGREIPVSFSSSILRDANGKVQGIVCLARESEKGPGARTEVPVGAPAPGASLTTFSQELRAPIHVILGMSSMLENARLNAEERQYLALLRQGGESLLSMGDRLLNGTETDSGLSIQFHLEDLLDSLGEQLALPSQERGLELSIFIEPDVDLNLRGDSVRLRLILLHLVTETLKVSRGGSLSILVSLKDDLPAASPGERKTFLFRMRRLPGDVTPGTSNARFPGLETIRSLLEALGGRARESDGDPRNDFAFELSLEVAVPGGWGKEKRPTTESSPRILLADTADTHRAGLREYLRTTGARLTEARDERSALKALADARETDRAFAGAVVDGRLLNGPAGPTELAASLAAAPGSPRLLVLLTLPDHEPWSGLRKESNDDPGESGTRFLIKPVKRRELLSRLGLADPHRGTRTESEPGPTKPLRILLAEDNQDSQLLFQAFLRNTPHQVDVADDGEEAVHLFKNGAYDIVFMDMQMPVMDGYTAVFKIRKWEEEQGSTGRAGRTPIYALTAFSLRDDVERSLRVGCTGHIAKPVSRESILGLLSDTRPGA